MHGPHFGLGRRSVRQNQIVGPVVAARSASPLRPPTGSARKYAWTRPSVLVRRPTQALDRRPDRGRAALDRARDGRRRPGREVVEQEGVGSGASPGDECPRPGTRLDARGVAHVVGDRAAHGEPHDEGAVPLPDRDGSQVDVARPDVVRRVAKRRGGNGRGCGRGRVRRLDTREQRGRAGEHGDRCDHAEPMARPTRGRMQDGRHRRDRSFAAQVPRPARSARRGRRRPPG